MKLRTEIRKADPHGWYAILRYPFQEEQTYWFPTRAEASSFAHYCKKVRGESNAD